MKFSKEQKKIINKLINNIPQSFNNHMGYVYKETIFNGKEVVLKVGDNALDYINQGYKVFIPSGLVILGNTGEVIKDVERSNK